MGEAVTLLCGVAMCPSCLPGLLQMLKVGLLSSPNYWLVCLECSGLVVYADGPLNLDRKVEDMSELFRPFHTLLRKIR